MLNYLLGKSWPRNFSLSSWLNFGLNLVDVGDIHSTKVLSHEHPDMQHKCWQTFEQLMWHAGQQGLNMLLRICNPNFGICMCHLLPHVAFWLQVYCTCHCEHSMLNGKCWVWSLYGKLPEIDKSVKDQRDFSLRFIWDKRPWFTTGATKWSMQGQLWYWQMY